MKYIALDFGNSRVKCHAQGPQSLGAFAYAMDEWYKTLLDEIVSFCNGEEYLIGISSVNPAMDQIFTSYCDGLSNNNHIRTKSLALGSGLIDFSLVSGMGEDRIHGLLGAICIADTPLITIDCGTAITFNVIDTHLVCLGGGIMPGLNTMYASLASETAGLPQLAPNPTTMPCGTVTADAMHSGISMAIIGAFSEICLKFPNAQLIVMGGDAPSIISILDESIKKRVDFRPECIALGIFKALELYDES